MIIRVPDPHPGRCLNHRTDPTDSYGVKQLRCLRMEGHTEACRFQEPVRLDDERWATSIYYRSEPQPWVEPQ